MTSGRAVTRRVLPGSPFNVPPAPVDPVDPLAVNDRVSHDRHGMGTVLETYGEAAVLVDFGAGVRRINLPNAKLIKL